MGSSSKIYAMKQEKINWTLLKEVFLLEGRNFNDDDIKDFCGHVENAKSLGELSSVSDGCINTFGEFILWRNSYYASQAEHPLSEFIEHCFYHAKIDFDDWTFLMRVHY